jgi:squalene-hopene/tetraprenyl-beta-curcumene cyclase
MKKLLLLTCVLTAIAASSLQAEEPAKLDAKTHEQMVTKGIDYLTTKGQAPDGSYSAQAGPGVTALITTAILRAGRSPDDPVVAKSLKYLEGFVREDGGISKTGSKLPNYETCLAVLCFKEANKDGRYDKVLKKADAYIKGEQWDESEGKDKKDINYGGAGYGGKSRPDLSNTAFLVDALKATGNKADSEAIQRALLFVSRCQNLETELTISPEALKNPDGGFFYTPAAGGSSPAGETAEGGLRSYGAMTYAGLKSMLYAGVGPDDKRVKAALKWLGKHYSVEENPGMGQRGVYYYYHTFAKALDAMGQNEFPDEKGVKHNWRNELIAELAKRQRADGSWANTEKQWMEGDANLATGFALLTLSYCKPAKEAAK